MGIAKYFVWADGVWREVDLASGRVTGWQGRARFVYVRRGRLQLARRRGVLRALQALAAGQPSAAADGPRLPNRKQVLAAAKSLAQPAHAPLAGVLHHCCRYYNGCNNTFNETKQVLTPLTPQQKREAGTQCGEMNAGTSTERNHTISINLNNTTRVTRDTEDSSGEDFMSAPKKRNIATKHNNRTELDVLLGKQETTETSKVSVKSQEKLDSLKISDVLSKTSKDSPNNRLHRLKRKQSNRVVRDRTDTSDEEILTNLKTASKVNPQEQSREPDIRERGAVCKELIVLEDDVAALRAFVARTCASALGRFDSDDAYKRSLFYAINPLVEIERCARLERALSERHEQALQHFATRLGLARRSDVESQASRSPSRSHRRRAAVRYTERSSSADTNKENNEESHASISKRHERRKKAVEGPTEPITRSGVTERESKVLRRREAKTEDNEPPRASRPSRGRGTVERGNKEEKERDGERVHSNRGCESERGSRPAVAESPKKDSTEEHSNKRSIEQLLNNEKTAQRGLKTKESVFKETKQSTTAHGTKDSVLCVSKESVMKEGKVQSTAKGIKVSAVQNGFPKLGTRSDDSDDLPIGGRSAPPAAPPAREYSTLEDHAIVSWLSCGSRASHVNGNVLWRELQEAFPRLAGRPRSWHSLRNRYLRHILPALGALHLPPADVSRLRAAAATGAIKNKRRAGLGGQRRNSIFKEASVRSAYSRRAKVPQLPPSTDDDEDAALGAGALGNDGDKAVADKDIVASRRARRHEPRKKPAVGQSPRYSDVTRQFAARHPRAPPSPPSPEPAPAPRERKLFNPNV